MDAPLTQRYTGATNAGGADGHRPTPQLTKSAVKVEKAAERRSRCSTVPSGSPADGAGQAQAAQAGAEFQQQQRQSSADPNLLTCRVHDDRSELGGHMSTQVSGAHGSPLRVQSPRTFQGSWAQAHAHALAAHEPVLVPITAYADDRGWSLMNLLNGVMSAQGQINFSLQYPGIVKAWHRHDKQTDFWTCVHGHIKAGVYRESDGAAWMAILGEHRPAVLIIPPPLWHGAACVGPTSAGLLYYVTHAYDPAQPDEHRRAWDSITGFPWAPRHG
jgi:dTDP-4-dehydrorhamnose 3,5-epimerase